MPPTRRLFSSRVLVALLLSLLCTIYQSSAALSESYQAQLQQQIYTALSSAQTITEQERATTINNLSQLSFDRVLLGLVQPSYLVKLISAQTVELVLTNYSLSESQGHTSAHHQSTSSHPYNVELAALSQYFIEYYTQFPISYNLLPTDPNTPQQYYTSEKRLVNDILHPITNLAITSLHADLRHTAISILSAMIREFPGTAPHVIKLLQYYSGEDVFIGTKLFQGSLESDPQVGGPQNANQRFLAKIVRLHLSAILYDDFELLRKASQTVLELYRDAPLDSKDATAPEGEDLRQRNAHYNTLSRQLHPNPQLASAAKRGSIYTQLNIKDITIDNVINQIHITAAQSETQPTLAECSLALSRSKLSPDHLPTLYSLVISPFYDVSHAAVLGLKRIGLVSAIPGTITHTVQEPAHDLAELDPASLRLEHASKKQQNKAAAPKQHLGNDGGLIVSDSAPHATVAKEYVSAVSQAELSTLLQPQQGQLAIKILSHASRKHPHPHLQQLSAAAFQDVILEVKAQLQSWFHGIKAKGLEMYTEQDQTRSSMQDIKYNLQFMAAGKKDRRRIAMEYELYQKRQTGHLHDADGNPVSSIQQLLFVGKQQPRSKAAAAAGTDDAKLGGSRKFDNGSVLVTTPTPSSASTKAPAPAPGKKKGGNKKAAARAAAKRLAKKELERFLDHSDAPPPSPSPNPSNNNNSDNNNNNGSNNSNNNSNNNNNNNNNNYVRHTAPSGSGGSVGAIPTTTGTHIPRQDPTPHQQSA